MEQAQPETGTLSAADTCDSSAPRILSFAAKILVILTIVTAVFTKNYALVVVAVVCGVAVMLFDYFKHLPAPVSLTATHGRATVDAHRSGQSSDRQQFVSSMQTPGLPSHLPQFSPPQDPSHPSSANMSFHHHLKQTQWASSAALAVEQSAYPEHSAHSARPRAKTQMLTMPDAAFPQDFDVNAVPVSRRFRYGQSSANAHARDVVTLGDCIPVNETMESRVGRSVLRRQVADLPIPRGAQAEFDRTMFRLNPLLPGPNMQLVTPEELANEQMQAAPMVQRVLPRRRH